MFSQSELMAVFGKKSNVKIGRFPIGKSFQEELIWILTNASLEGPEPDIYEDNINNLTI